MWQKPSFHYKHRLQKEPIRRQIISQESVASFIWKAASRAKLYRKPWWGEGAMGRSDGLGIRRARKKNGKAENEFRNQTKKSEEIEIKHKEKTKRSS